MQGEDLVIKYSQSISIYEEFRIIMEKHLEELLKNEDISFHTIVSRTKDIDSLAKKIELKNKYQELEEITDLVGIRIITYYSDTVDLISKLIESEFVIDRENSIDKRKSLDPDRFGYKSLHYVVTINDELATTSEYEKYANMKFEIQICSILQYTWAEIEHDLGYKSQEEIPYDIKRSFSRLAGLLELADEEFLRIKNDIFAYQDRLSLSYLNAKIDKDSLHIFKIKSPEFNQLIELLKEEFGANRVSQGNFENMIRMLKFININTLGEVDAKLKQYQELIAKYANILYKDATRSKIEVMSGDTPLLCLCYFILVIEKDEYDFERFANRFISSAAFKDKLLELKRVLLDESK